MVIVASVRTLTVTVQLDENGAVWLRDLVGQVINPQASSRQLFYAHLYAHLYEELAKAIDGPEEERLEGERERVIVPAENGKVRFT